MQCDVAPPGVKAEIIPLTISLIGDFTDVSNSVHYRYYPDVFQFAYFLSLLLQQYIQGMEKRMEEHTFKYGVRTSLTLTSFYDVPLVQKKYKLILLIVGTYIASTLFLHL